MRDLLIKVKESSGKKGTGTSVSTLDVTYDDDAQMLGVNWTDAPLPSGTHETGPTEQKP